MIDKKAMNTRVPDSNGSASLTSRINMHRLRLNVLQEQLATGRRINRPSDDPSGAEMVLNMRTSMRQIEQFQRNAETVNLKLTGADDALAAYETALDRVKVLVSRGLSEISTPQTREAVAIELEGLRNSILSVANTISGDEYVFGGTRQNAPPFDRTTGQPAVTSATAQYIQIEPGAPALASGVIAEQVFGDSNSTIFEDITAAVTALRGTGDPAADRLALQNAMSRMTVHGQLASAAHARIGASQNAADIALENLSTNLLAFDARITEIEGADFAETAVGIADAQRALDATLQVAAQGRRSLFDFLT